MLVLARELGAENEAFHSNEKSGGEIFGSFHSYVCNKYTVYYRFTFSLNAGPVEIL